ncbi:MAG: response regulator [Mucilaginibacter sp.]
MKKIIIIDNDRDTLDILSFLFEDIELEVFRYTNRISIGEVIQKNPDIILLDYYLDDCYGSEICRELKEDPITGDIPIVLLSTSINLDKIAIESGADACLAKPFDIQNLENLVGELLDIRVTAT